MAAWQLNPLTTSSNAGSLAAYVFDSQGTQHVIYIDNNDFHVHELWWDSNGWHPNDLTKATGAPVTDGSGALAAYAFDLGEIRSLGGGLPPVIIPSPASTQHVNFTTIDGDVHELWWDTSGGWHHNDLSKAANMSVSESGTAFWPGLAGYVSYFQGTQHVICNGADLDIHELWWDGNWHPNDLTAVATGAPNSPASSPVGCAFESQRTQHVFYTGAENDVHELLWDANDWQWHDNDVTAKSGATPGSSYSPLAAYVFNAPPSTLRVNYIGMNDVHVYQLSSSGDGVWNTPPIDLTGEAAASVVANTAGLGGYEFKALGSQHVDYIGNDLHVHELSWYGNWYDEDLTKLANVGANTPAPTTDFGPVGYAVEAQGTRHVIYVGEDGNIYELLTSGI